MRMTRSFISTLREVPRDTEARSHILMLRSGLIRAVAPGRFAWLPLGWRAMRKIESLVRDALSGVGMEEICLPSLQPEEGSTRAALAAALAGRGMVSYRDLPLGLFQIGPRFRDEDRPRGGVLKTRESVACEGWIFSATESESLQQKEPLKDALGALLKRCGLICLAVEGIPEQGAMPRQSIELLAPCEAGEVEIALCSRTGFASRRDLCPCPPPQPAQGSGSVPSIEQVATPGASTVEQVCAFLKVEPSQLIKTLIFSAGEEPLVALVRGDREASMAKVARLAGCAVEMATPDTIQRVTGAPVGFAGPVGLTGVRIVADPEVAAVQDGVTGANTGDAHYVHVVPGRDFPIPELADLRMVNEGEEFTDGSVIEIAGGVEVGRLDIYSDRFCESLEALYTDGEGRRTPLWMTGFELDLARVAAAAIEQNNDERGILWPASIAPYDVHILALNMKDEAVAEQTSRIESLLEAEGFCVLTDDRMVSPGVKFNDADLLGIPLRVIIGRKSLDEGCVQIARRCAAQEKLSVPVDRVVEEVRSIHNPFLPLEGGG
jgi:prolyl-tRNA synthetase